MKRKWTGGRRQSFLPGKKVRLKFFCMRSKYSGKHFVRFIPASGSRRFLMAHIQAFAFFGGVFPVLIYDNLTTAVQKVLRGRDRIEQEGFSQVQSVLQF